MRSKYRAFVEALVGAGLSRRQESGAWAFYAIDSGKTFLLRLLLHCEALESYAQFQEAVARRWQDVRLQPAQEAAARAIFAIPLRCDRAELLSAISRYEGLAVLPQLRSDGTPLYSIEGGRYQRRSAS